MASKFNKIQSVLFCSHTVYGYYYMESMYFQAYSCNCTLYFGACRDRCIFNQVFSAQSTHIIIMYVQSHRRQTKLIVFEQVHTAGMCIPAHTNTKTYTFTHTDTVFTVTWEYYQGNINCVVWSLTLFVCVVGVCVCVCVLFFTLIHTPAVCEWITAPAARCELAPA